MAANGKQQPGHTNKHGFYFNEKFNSYKGKPGYTANGTKKSGGKPPTPKKGK